MFSDALLLLSSLVCGAATGADGREVDGPASLAKLGDGGAVAVVEGGRAEPLSSGAIAALSSSVGAVASSIAAAYVV